MAFLNKEDRISKWIREKVKDAKADGIVFGLSGGLDSAVVAILSKKALGNNALALVMPCHSFHQDELDTKLLITKFNIKAKWIDLSPIYDTLLKILPRGDKIACANLKARLRMMTLYYFANKFNYLVAGTGNKSERTIGYFTKYGDGAVDILPLGGLLKGEVRELAKELKIPSRIINKPPSAGLWEGQTDEGEIGILYKELDAAITGIESGNLKGIKPGILHKVEELIKTSRHKRESLPIFRP